MAEYTPTTEQVREEYSITVIDGTVLPSRARAFDRWLAAYEAEVRERIAQDIEAEARRRWNAGWTDWTERESGLDDGLTEAARIARGATR